MFDKLRERAPRAAASIHDLHAAHEELSERIRKLADGLRALLAEAEMPREDLVRWAIEFIATQRQHMDMEELEFFPAAEKMLTEKDGGDLQAEMAKGPDPRTRAKVLEKFGQLRQSIFAWQDQDEALRPRHLAAACPRPAEH
jgi:hemerythrin-like domain-containing protein